MAGEGGVGKAQISDLKDSKQCLVVFAKVGW
jgi:hypothetical protein